MRLGALKGKHPAGLGQTLVKQALLIGEFFLDQGQLPGHGIGLGDDAFDLRRDLGATFLQLFSLARGGFAAGEEQLALAFDLFGHIGPGLGQFGQFAGKDRLGLVVAFGFQPGAAGDQFEKLTFDDGQFRLQKRAVQPDQQIAGLDRLGFVHGDLGNDAAVQMLHDLAVLVHFNLARGDDGAVDGGHQRPAAQTDHQGPLSRPRSPARSPPDDGRTIPAIGS